MEIHANIQSQYEASLSMLREAIIKCPDAIWDDQSYRNVFWQISYHALFFTHLYVQPQLSAFTPWANHRSGYEDFPQEREPYSKTDVMEYVVFVCQQVAQQVPQCDMDAPSGFHWLPFNRLEAHMYNIRHLQHHVGELCERLGVVSHVEVGWVIKTKDYRMV